MKIKELMLSKAPDQGWMLAYTPQKVIFRKYKKSDLLTGELPELELLEIHLFDQEKEYRAVKSLSPRFPEGYIEAVADFALDPMTTYEEKVLLEKEFGGSIKVINHIDYDESNGMAAIDNYRLVMEKS